MTPLIVTCLMLGIALSLAVKVIALTIIVLVGGATIFGVSLLAGAPSLEALWFAVAAIIAVEVGYFIGLIAQAALSSNRDRSWHRKH